MSSLFPTHYAVETIFGGLLRGFHVGVPSVQVVSEASKMATTFRKPIHERSHLSLQLERGSRERKRKML